LKKLRITCLLAILVLATAVLSNVNAEPLVQPAQCYRCAIEVDLVNVQLTISGTSSPPFALMISPSQVVAPVGTQAVLKFHVIYTIGRAVVLNPDQASFSFTNSSGAAKTLINVTVVPVPAQPGNYTYTFAVSPDFPTGQVTATVLENSLSDGSGNIGPSHNVDSILTINPADQSVFDVGPLQTTTTTQPAAPSYAVPAIIAFLLILALILFVARRFRKKK
jgi:hypothetical protein